MDAIAALEALRRFGTGLSQHARLITLATAQAAGLPESLMVERFNGREAVNALFTFTVDGLSVSADLDLDALLGEEMTITLLQPDASRRAWHGIGTSAGWTGADGGVARYRLRLREPDLRRASRACQTLAPTCLMSNFILSCQTPESRFLTQAIASVLCDPDQSNTGWDMATQENKGKTLKQLRDGDGTTPKYTGRCYAKHIKDKS